MNTLEVTVPAKQTAVAAPVDVTALDTAKPLDEIFQPYQATLDKWQAKADALIVTDIRQKTEMQQARLARLELKEARCTLEKTRKGLVEGLKARTTKIDTAARTIREKCEELEEKLKASEEFAERHAEKVKAELKLSREAELAPFMETPIVGDLSNLSEADYAKTLADAKQFKQFKIEAAAKAEAERIAKEKAEAEERARIAAENERLKAEAAETARLAEIERQRVEAEKAEAARLAEEERKRIAAERAEEQRKADEEKARVAAEHTAALRKAQEEADRAAEVARKEREAIEAKAKEAAAKAAKEAKRLKDELEAKAREESEAKARAAKAEADERARVEAEQKAAAAAPDKEKLVAFAATVRQLVIPGMDNAEVKELLVVQTQKFAAWIDKLEEKL